MREILRMGVEKLGEWMQEVSTLAPAFLDVTRLSSPNFLGRTPIEMFRRWLMIALVHA